MDRPQLRMLRVSGSGKEDATVEFGRGLTYVTGISDTGKSHVLEWLDYALGSQTSPRKVPEGQGYDQVALEIEKGGTSYVVRRWLSETEVATLFKGSLGEWDGEAGETIKVNIAQAESLKTLSGWLLDQSGFDTSMRVVRNQRGDSQTLSFRTIAPLLLVRESDIISEGSPVLSGQHVQATANRSAFQIVLTGDAPTLEEIQTLKDAHQQREAAKQRIDMLDGFIADLREDIRTAGLDRSDLEAELARIQDELADVSVRVSESGTKARELMRERNSELRAADEAARAIAAAEELQARFGLLEQHYWADLRRLEFVREGGHFFGQITASHCPRCGRPINVGDECHPESADLKQVERAATKEMKKLEPRLADLAKAVADARDAARNAEADLKRHRSNAQALDEEIGVVANPTAEAARDRVAEITKRRRAVEGELLKFRELDRYLDARQEADLVARRKIERYRPEQDLPSLKRLTVEIAKLLEKWRFPTGSDVRFNPETDDLVVVGKERRTYGKGARAVTHAAFNIGLMRHCEKAATPHPGFVALDSPLSPFKGITDDEPDPELTKDLHTAFLHSMATAEGEGQVIVIDNVSPPNSVRGHAKIHEFLGTQAITGRKGFFPVP